MINGGWLRSTYFHDLDGITSQRVGGIHGKFGKFNFSYENDGTPFSGTLGDGGDSYRTVSASIGWGDLSINMNLYTGYRQFNPQNNVSQNGYPHKVVANAGANKYREGIFTFGYKNYRLGWNSEGVRHAFQNQFAHGVVKKQAWFRFVPGMPNRPVIGTRVGSMYHNW